MTDLIERLLACHQKGKDRWGMDIPEFTDAADALTAQAAEIARLTAELATLSSATDAMRTMHRNEIHSVWMPLANDVKAQVADAYARGLREAAELARVRVARWLEIEPPYDGTLDEAIETVEKLPDAILALIPKPATEKPE